MRKFKVGDKVRVVGQDEAVDSNTIGYIGYVKSIECENTLDEHYELDNTWYYHPEYLVSVSDEEIAKLRERLKEEFELVQELGGRADLISSMMHVDNLIKYIQGR